MLDADVKVSQYREIDLEDAGRAASGSSCSNHGVGNGVHVRVCLSRWRSRGNFQSDALVCGEEAGSEGGPGE